jgi:CelD/BcsL family acetyltransferase involved in cellulose biosynthesis
MISIGQSRRPQDDRGSLQSESASAGVAWEDDLTCLGPAGKRLDDLLARVSEPTVFIGWDWLSTAARHLVAPERAILVETLMREGRLAGCLPMTIGPERVHGIPIRSLRLLGDPLADRIPLPVAADDPDSLKGLLDGLVDGRVRFDAAILGELPDNPMFRSAVEAWSANRGVAAHWQLCSRTPVLRFGCRDQQELESGYSASLKTRLRRSRKKLDIAGRVALEQHRPASHQVDELLASIKAVEDASWKGHASVGIFSTPARQAFFRELSHRLAVKQQLEIWLLRLDDRIISYRYGFYFDNVFLDYNLAYLPEYQKFGPGRILLNEIIRASFAQARRAVDASRASLDRSHLLEDWPHEVIAHHRLWIFGSTLRGLALRATICSGKPIFHGLRRHFTRS